MVLPALDLAGCMDAGILWTTAVGRWAAVRPHQAEAAPRSLSRCGVGGGGLGLPSSPNLGPGAMPLHAQGAHLDAAEGLANRNWQGLRIKAVTDFLSSKNNPALS